MDSFRNESGPASPRQGGQILLLVVLVMIVALTVGLSIVSRSITNLRSTTEEVSSQKALSAAEAGIEQAIQTSMAGTIANPSFSSDASFETKVSEILGTNFLVNGGNFIPQDEGADIWLVEHKSDGTLDYATVKSPNFFTLYWGLSSDNCSGSSIAAAIEVIIISRDPTSGAVTSKRYGYDPCNRGNNFQLADSGSFATIPGKIFKYKTPTSGSFSISITNGVIVRVIPLYTPTPIGVGTCNNAGQNCTALPSQGFVIDSTGKSQGTQRRITVVKGYEQLAPQYFSYGLFSP